jgi:hypothetical protein
MAAKKLSAPSIAGRKKLETSFTASSPQAGFTNRGQYKAV